VPWLLFNDRRDAGKTLARRLAAMDIDNPIVLGIPRGGVVVAHEIARALKAPLDVSIPRKIGAPHNPELAIGAVAQDGALVIDKALVRMLGVSEDYLEKEAERQRAEIERRLSLYRRDRPAVDVSAGSAILADDGIATGATVMASLRGLRSLDPARVILAVPVAPPDTLERLAGEADDIVCLASPEPFYAVGQFYRHFEQVTDEEVVALMGQETAAPERS